MRQAPSDRDCCDRDWIVRNFFKNFFFRAGEGEGSEEEEWHLTSIMLLLVQVGSRTPTSSTQPLAKGQPLPVINTISMRIKVSVNQSWSNETILQFQHPSSKCSVRRRSTMYYDKGERKLVVLYLI